jgi:tRNA G18 (ribose-2'-O)-methylase SpoU
MINFENDTNPNLALLIRTAVCYGVKDFFVIGSVPDKSFLRAKSGTTIDYINLVSFPNPTAFLEECRDNNYNIVCAELCDGAESIYDYTFKNDKHTVIVMGNEYTGVPADIIFNSDPVFIPMNGIGYSLNVSNAGSILINEFQRQYSKEIIKLKEI